MDWVAVARNAEKLGELLESVGLIIKGLVRVKRAGKALYEKTKEETDEEDS